MAGFNTAAEEVTFINDVSGATGVDPRLVAAWIRAEGAYPSPPGTGGHNWLNMRPYGSDVGVVGQSPGGFDQFDNEKDAAISTVRRIKQPFLWDILGPVVAAHGTVGQQAAAIGRSGWDVGHYQEAGGPPGSALIADLPAGTTASSPATKGGGGGGSALTPGDIVGGLIPGGIGPAISGGASHIPGVGAISDVSRLIKFLTSVRFPELVFGMLLVVVGLFIISKGLIGKTAVELTGLGDLAKKMGGQTSSGASAGPISEAPRRVQRRAGFEGPAARPNRSAQVRAAAARASGPGELPADF